MSNPTLADPALKENPHYFEQDYGLPRFLRMMSEDDKAHLYYLAEKKAWIRATEIAPYSDEEQAALAEAKKKGGEKLEKQVRDRLYRRHHWESLRWFLFGGLVDIPVQEDPTRAWDPKTNPFLKVRIRGFVQTQDEHDEAQPYKRLPDKEYLRLLSYAWVHEPLLAIPKSRQMMITWLYCAIAAHETLFRDAKNTAWISKKFDDANAHIENRIKGVADRLPRRFPIPEYKFIKGSLKCVDTNSVVMAMGEEAKGLRQYTFSWVFDDEAAFQEQASDIITAALPTVKGGGRFTLVSSANGKEVFHGVVSENGRIPVPAGK